MDGELRRNLQIRKAVERLPDRLPIPEMHLDGFGGAVMRITPEAIQYRSTYEMLEEMRDTPIQCGVSDTTGFETRSRLKAIAGAVGWDSSTLLLLVARWAAEEGQAERLIDYLDRKAAPEES